LCRNTSFLCVKTSLLIRFFCVSISLFSCVHVSLLCVDTFWHLRQLTQRAAGQHVSNQKVFLVLSYASFVCKYVSFVRQYVSFVNLYVSLLICEKGQHVSTVCLALLYASFVHQHVSFVRQYVSFVNSYVSLLICVNSRSVLQDSTRPHVNTSLFCIHTSL